MSITHLLTYQKPSFSREKVYLNGKVQSKSDYSFREFRKENNRGKMKS